MAKRKTKPKAVDPRRKMGRKEMRSKFLRELQKCGSRSAAAGVVGVHERTVMREMQRDGRFRRNAEMAEQRWKAKAINRIQDNAKKDWRADQWLLSKKFKDEFGEGAMMTVDAFNDLIGQVIQCARESFGADAQAIERFENLLHEQVRIPTARTQEIKGTTLTPDADVTAMDATIPAAPAATDAPSAEATPE